MSKIKEHFYEEITTAQQVGARVEKPILFSTSMVQAILAGRKTQTRRSVGLSEVNYSPDQWEFLGMELNPEIEIDFKKQKTLEGYFAVFANKTEEINLYVKSRYGKPGDLLWVREMFAPTDAEYLHKETKNQCVYRADFIETETIKEILTDMNWKWKPSIHMPKNLARIWSEVEEIRIERLQDISEEDAKAEGVKLHKRGVHYLDYIAKKQHTTQFYYCFKSAIRSFRSLWNLINKHTDMSKPNIEWRENPWIWVIKYKILSTTGKPQICYKSNELCKYDCKGLCRENM